MKSFSLLLISLLFLASSVSHSQQFSLDKEKLLQMAQSGKLSQMNPDEIRDLITQSGLSEDELLQFARDRNIEFTQFLGSQNQAGGLVKAVAESIRVPVSAPATRKVIGTVPSFSNRPEARDLKPFGFDIF